MQRNEALQRADQAITLHARMGVKSVFYTHPNYSRRLNQCADAPTQLFTKGNLELNKTRFVAIVGTRSATDYGKKLCRELIASFQGKNITVISGLALGIDTYVHHYCLEYNIPTIGVLGHGLDRIYPANNRTMAQRMLQHGGLISEFVPGTTPDRENFPKRNRIVAGLCDATIVIESKTSGGSLITANIANSYNRDVFAFPGSVHNETSAGCNALIAANKAHLLQDAQSFCSYMQWDTDKNTLDARQYHCFPELSAVQQEVMKEIQGKPKIQLDILAARLAMPISSLQVELLQLRLSGIIEELPGSRYNVIHAHQGAN
jgi:DNA processing protein